MSYMCVINATAEKWQEIPLIVMAALCTRVGYSALVNGGILPFQRFTVFSYIAENFLHMPLHVTCASISLGHKLQCGITDEEDTDILYFNRCC